MRRIDLARGLGLTASGVTRLLDGLERDGLVAKRTVRRGRPRHATRCSRTPGARAAGAGFVLARRLGARRSSRSATRDEELETLADLLGRLPQ